MYAEYTHTHTTHTHTPHTHTHTHYTPHTHTYTHTHTHTHTHTPTHTRLTKHYTTEVPTVTESVTVSALTDIQRGRIVYGICISLFISFLLNNLVKCIGDRNMFKMWVCEIWCSDSKTAEGVKVMKCNAVFDYTSEQSNYTACLERWMVWW